MSRALNDLEEPFRFVVFELLARCVEAGIPVMITDTLRTIEEQKVFVQRGTSWTLKSKHLEGKAIDIVPYSVYDNNGPDKLNWDEKHPHWKIIGEIGQSLGLKWGVISKGKRFDLGHFEWIE